eukprot:g11078.t2
MASVDRHALAALFHSADGAQWIKNDNWNTDAELSTWYGVEVDSESRVVKLSLNGNNLRGAVPAELGKLTGLLMLRLDGNHLEGVIPKELGALTRLERLWLNNNAFSELGGAEDTLQLVQRLGDKLRLGNNPWIMPPEGVVEAGMPAVERYLLDVQAAQDAGGHLATLELLKKVVFVGPTSAGKTSLVSSIASGHGSPGAETAAASTVGIQMLPRRLRDTTVELFDCAGHVDYAGMYQTFLPRRALYLVVVDIADYHGRENLDEVIEAGIMPWLRCLSFRAPGCRVILVANKCDASIDDFIKTTERVEKRVRELLDEWSNDRGLRGQSEGLAKGLTILPGVSRVSCLPDNFRQTSGLTALTSRIHDQAATSIRVPPAWVLALGVTGALRAGDEPIRAAREKLRLPTTNTTDEGVSRITSPFVSRAELSRQWRHVVGTLEGEAPAAAMVNPDGALDGALQISDFTGSILRVDGGDGVFLDTTWLSNRFDSVLSPEPGDTMLERYWLSQRCKLVEEGVLCPQFAGYLWNKNIGSGGLQSSEVLEGLARALVRLGVALPVEHMSLAPNVPYAIPKMLVVARLPKACNGDQQRLLDGLSTKMQPGEREVTLKWRFENGGPPDGLVQRVITSCHILGALEAALCWRYGAVFRKYLDLGGDTGGVPLFTMALSASRPDDSQREIVVRVIGSLGDERVWEATRYVASAVATLANKEWPGVGWEGWSEYAAHHEQRVYLTSSTDVAVGDPLIAEATAAAPRGGFNCPSGAGGVLGLLLERLGNVVDIEKDPFNSADRDALEALYRSTDGPEWAHKNNWNTDADLSTWDGVKLNDKGRVVELSLDQNNLQGTIPPEIGQLAAVTHLRLSENKLSGSIPPALGHLTVLTHLWLNGNHLSGQIPEELGCLTALTKLWLNHNRIGGSIPPQLGALKSLRVLDLGENQLTGPVPPNLSSLEALEIFDLLKNNLTEMPPEILDLLKRTGIQPAWNGNPWVRPPSSVLDSGVEHALGWWDDVRRFGEGKSNKLKIVLVGLARAGKTTVVRHLTKRSAPRRPDRTVGIEITPSWRPLDEGPLQACVWDFAGQADYYSSHQLFLTRGALFLLVVNLHEFFEEVRHVGEEKFTDRGRRIYWWLQMLFMRVPGAAIVLVGSHADKMKSAEVEQAKSKLHNVVRQYVQQKKESATTRRGLTSRSGSTGSPLVLHDEVFAVSRFRSSVDELRKWIVKAAAGEKCPTEFNFPAVDQTLSKAWIDAYEAMDALKRRRPCVLWSQAVNIFENRMGRDVRDSRDASAVLLRAMQHREAEGGVLLSLRNASDPVGSDMIHLDPAWLIELVRRLADHNLVDENPAKQGTIRKGLREYAIGRRIDVGRLIETHRLYIKSGCLNLDYLRFLWVHREIDPPGTAVVLEDPEFDSIVSTMLKLLVMYQSPHVEQHSLVVPARLPEFGDEQVFAERNIADIVIKLQCSFGQIYPPPGIVGRFLAWLTGKIQKYLKCWQHGAFFWYAYQGGCYSVFLYESDVQEPHEDGTVCVFAGLTLGVQGTPPLAPMILLDMRESLRNMVADSAYGYPGLMMWFGDEEELRSTQLEDLPRQLDNYGARLLELAKELKGVAHQLWDQDLLAANSHPSEYPRLVIIRPEAEVGRDDNHEGIQRTGWERWRKAWQDLSLSDVGMHHKFRLHFLCEHDLSEIPCGPDGRGFPIAQPKDWVKQIAPLMQVSLWILRVAVGTLSRVDLPLNGLLDAVAHATGAELVDGVARNASIAMNGDAVPVLGEGEGATNSQIERFRHLRGKAYEALCELMPKLESPRPRCSSACLPFRRPTVAFVNWRDHAVQVEDHRGWAWVLRTNKEAYLHHHQQRGEFASSRSEGAEEKSATWSRPSDDCYIGATRGAYDDARHGSLSPRVPLPPSSTRGGQRGRGNRWAGAEGEVKTASSP